MHWSELHRLICGDIPLSTWVEVPLWTWKPSACQDRVSSGQRERLLAAALLSPFGAEMTTALEEVFFHSSLPFEYAARKCD